MHQIVTFFPLVFDGRPRGKDAVTSSAGAVVGEPTNEGTNPILAWAGLYER